MSKLLKNIIYFIIFVSQLAFAMPLNAAGPTEEIVVTARKRSEDLQSVPVAITALSEDFIEQMGISRTEDLVKVTPGLTFTKGIGGADRRPDIRGLSPVRGRSTVAILVDGVDITSDSGVGTGGGTALNVDLFELERIEVVRGPQSALYGRNAFAGAISYITKKPSSEFDGFVSGEFDEYGTRILKANVSGPLIGEKLLGRIGVGHSETDGQYVNAENGVRLGDNDTNSFAVALTWIPSESFETNFRFDYVDQEGGQSAVAGIANNACASVDEFATVVNTDFSLCERRPNSDFTQIYLGTVPDIGPSDIRLSDDHFFGIQNEQKRFTWTFDWSLPFGSLVSVSSYGDYDETDDFDLDQQPDGVPVTGTAAFSFSPDVSAGAHTDTVTGRNTLFQDLRLVGQSGDRVAWMFGGEYFEEDWDRLAYVRYDPKFERPADNLPAGKEATWPGLRTRDIESWGVYGAVDIDFFDTWTLSASARYQEEDVTFFAEAICFQCDPQVLENPPFFRESNSFESFDPRLSVEFAATDDALVYVSVAKGSKPGGFTAQTALTDDSKRFDKETMWTYELGAKTTWFERALVINAALFHIDNRDKQVAAVEGFPPQTYTDNVGKAEIDGFEFEMIATLVDDLTLTMSYAYTDGEYVDYFFESAKGGASFFDVDPSTGRFGLVPVDSDPDFDVAGKKLINVPKHALNASAEYVYSFSTDVNAIARFSYSYRSKRFLDTQNFAKFDDKHTVEFMVGILHPRVEAYWYVENAFDDDTPESGVSFVNFADDFQTLNVIYPAQQRTLGTRVRVFF